MTNRRPQDPQTKRMPDPEADVPTFDPGATVMPDDLDPDKTAGPQGFAAPRPRAVRGGAAANPANTNPPAADPTLTANDLGALREAVRKKAATGLNTRPKRKGPGWAVWVVAFLLLGGIGFGVAWLVMNNPGEAPPAEAATPKPADNKADAAAVDASAAADASADAAAADAVADSSADTAADAVADSSVDAAADAAADASAGAVADAPSDAASTDAADPSTDVAAADPSTDVAPPDAGADAGAPPDAGAAGPIEADTVGAASDVVAVEKAVAPNPAEATRLNEQGLSARKAGDHAGALALYERATKADPDAVWPRYNYACELAIAGRAKDALDELTKLYKLGTPEAKRALQAARKDSDFNAIKTEGRFFRLTNF